MHVVVPRVTLLTALERVQGILVKRSTNLALSCVLLVAKGETLTVTATDILITSIAKYAATVIKEDVVAVDGAILCSVVRAFGADDVTIATISGNRIRVSCGASVANLNTLNEDDFPPAQATDGNPKSKFVLRGADLARVFDQVQYAVCADENRYGLNGIYVEQVRLADDVQAVRFCATDGSRLTWSQAPLSEGGIIGPLKKRLLPKKGLAEARRSIKAADESWTVEVFDRIVTLEGPEVRIIARLVDGEFPDYRQVIPQDGYAHKVVLERGPFSDALRRISLFATDRNHTTAFDFGSDTLVLSADNVDTGDARDDLPVTLEGQPFKTGFNGAYWKDVLGATQGDLVVEINGILDPCAITMKDNANFFSIVMPMRLG